MGVKICLDAGHYGKYNQSAVVPEFYESEFNWKFHLLLKKCLEAYGIQVITTRDDPEKDRALRDRGEEAKGCNLFLSIHANWSQRETADYPVAIVPIDGQGDALGKKLAQCVQKQMGTKEPADVWTRKTDKGYDWYGVIRGAASVGVTGIILEHSFYSNSTSARWLLAEENLQKLAQAEAEVIAAHFGVEKPVVEKMVALSVPVLRKGSKGDAVKAMQTLLLGYGYKMESTDGKTQYGADGSFGGGTERALTAYQEVNGLEADGVCGPKTWASLLGIA